jgi:2-polyprenyl-3-methyl-5-hydroxy-6-metoxy-1,4-benzoquinol methylase
MRKDQAFCRKIPDKAIDLADWKVVRSHKEVQAFSRIRDIMKMQAKEILPLPFHITSDLNWLRYIKQVELLEDIIPQESRVLDIGCGLGHTTALLASVREDLEITGADTREHITWNDLRKSDLAREFCICDATSLPFCSESFQVIVSFGVMEHAVSDLAFLKEIHRCLKRGGYNIIFQLPNRYSLSEYICKKIRIWHHERTYTGKDITDLINTCGFDIDHLSREHLIPAQVQRISQTLENAFNRYHNRIYELDGLLCKTPLSLMSQDHIIISRKR